MVSVMQSPADYRSTPPRSVRGDDTAMFLSRWLKVWVILLTVVTLVVVGYLIVITNSLANINGNLATANSAVTGAGGHVVSLPQQVDRINGALSGIDPALKPIPGQADDIISALTSIRDKLRNTDSSLKDTSAVLKTVLGSVNSIEGVLVAANQNDGPCGGGVVCGPGQLGVQNIHERVDNANRILDPARADADGILANLRGGVNPHLTAICTGLASGILPLLTGISGCGRAF